jgi:glycosyltransferase 2 family protein
VAKQSRRWLGPLLRLVVSVSLIVWILRGADLARVGDVLRSADAGLLLVAFMSYFVGYVVSVARWRVLLAVQGVKPPFAYLYGSFMIGMFFNQLLPTTIGGDVVRYQYTSAGGRGAAASAVLLDRTFGTVALMIFAVAGFALAQDDALLPQTLLQAVAALLFGGLLVLAFAFVAPASPDGWVRRATLALPGKARAPAENLLAQFAAFRRRHDVVLAALGWSLVLQCIVVAHYLLVGVALGLDVPLSAYVFIVPLATVAMALPISINGIGVREGVLGYLLGLHGVDASTSLVFAWVLYAMLLAHGLLGGVVFSAVRMWRREQ